MHALGVLAPSGRVLFRVNGPNLDKDKEFGEDADDGAEEHRQGCYD